MANMPTTANINGVIFLWAKLRFGSSATRQERERILCEEGVLSRDEQPFSAKSGDTLTDRLRALKGYEVTVLVQGGLWDKKIEDWEGKVVLRRRGEQRQPAPVAV